MAGTATDVASMMQSFQSLFVGSKSNSQETTSSSAGAMVSNDALIRALMPAATGADPATDAIVNNIMQKAAIAFGPTVGSENTAGLYKTTVLRQLATEASARATGEASAAVLAHQTAAQQIAAQAIRTSVDANKTVVGARATPPSISPVVSAMLGAGTLSLGVFNSKDKILAALGFGDSSDASIKLAERAAAGKPANAAALADEAAAAREAALDPANIAADSPLGATGTADVGNVSVGSFSGGGSASASLEAPLLDVGTDSGLLDASVGGAGSAAALEGGTAIGAAELGTDAGAAAAGVEIGGDAAIGAGAELGTDAAFVGGAEVAGDTAAAAGGAEVLGDVATAAAVAWIVCTELVRQGRLPRKYWAVGARKFASYPEIGKHGYYIWAIPSVRHLRSRPNSYYSRFLCSIFNTRAEHVAACAGVRGAKKSIAGACISGAVWTLCAALALTVCQFLKPPNWQALYAEQRS